MKNYREKQFHSCLDDENAFRFYLIREQTRYRQRNYVKHRIRFHKQWVNFYAIIHIWKTRNRQLEHINHECTLRDYHCQNQRKRMTRELRKEIMIRDNYTCQQCGKYMPDEVGLHIDHITPVSKGGKTIRSNLQVLCSKCNGRKSNKI